ncbi:uncharacterized protein [Miscanthus floridulus]|uniref:uncharacterized protein n=1 Tax=Miscanthus floridulus TaxID=154761 RepID=UPI0034594DB4
MNPPAEISSSTQLLLDEIRKIFHNYEAKWDRKFTEQDGAREASPGVLVLSPSAADGVELVADNCGGFFEQPADIPFAPTQTVAVVVDNWGGLFEQPPDNRSAPTQAAAVVADNWGGLFEQPVHIWEVRDLESTDQIRIESCLTSTVCIAPAPIASAAIREIEPEESLPAYYLHQIQEPEEKLQDTDITTLEEALSKPEAGMQALARPPRLRVSPVAPAHDAVFDSELSGTAGKAAPPTSLDCRSCTRCPRPTSTDSTSSVRGGS